MEIQPGEYHYSQQALHYIKLLWCSGNSTSACLLVLGSIPGKADFEHVLLLAQFEIVGPVRVHEQGRAFQIGPI